jgi:hypothetical protein
MIKVSENENASIRPVRVTGFGDFDCGFWILD